MVWRPRPNVPELPLDGEDVKAILRALFDIRRDTSDILRILTEEDDEEEEAGRDEP